VSNWYAAIPQATGSNGWAGKALVAGLELQSVDRMTCFKVEDAQLVAAAPDRLEACKAALGAFEHNNAINWDDLRRAIEKAEGN
jgi:hypothetical protein